MMEKVASKAKSTVAKAKSTVKIIAKVPQTVGRTVLGVPQTVGRTILSVPDKIFKKSKEKQKTEPQYEFAERLAFISQEIIENQQGRQMVRESQLECMKEITNHLKPFLVQHPSATYEQWVAELHPDNAEYSDGRIDHRFYVEDSDHRLLWNEFMKELAFIDRIVRCSSFEPG